MEPKPLWGPGGGEEYPSEEGCVAVGFALVGGVPVRDVGSGGGEDVVVDVGVGQGGVRVLVEAVEEEHEAEGDREGEDEGGREGGGHCGKGGGIAAMELGTREVGIGIASIEA